jgi:hypothetical protein
MMSVYHCDRCDLSFDTPQAIANHAWWKHTYDPSTKRTWKFKPRFCKMCDKEFIPTGSRALFCRTCMPIWAGEPGACRRLGISYPTYLRLLEEQGYACAICPHKFAPINDNPGVCNDRCLDHDHITGEIRGILCHRCNVRMQVFDETDWLVRALAYKTKPGIKPYWADDTKPKKIINRLKSGSKFAK